ncbi:DUF4003 family protein [Lysinibacillus sp. SGAir0095]|uniref:DUF4003 family protein n=1 Tax=Lysinibacillus sp. SGAir0095 TaxID=2070463 RepID=UPI0010CCF405|nr:DUF4003 family protein [Lysinibacillus sp. SGAir0095]QCR34233.1 hypothetical protein C1N55_19845 [Lysinibacillus sp. SGAir0095]
MSEEQFIKAFQDNYNRLFNYTGGHDIQLMHSLACRYTLAQKQFSGVILQKIIEEIQESGEKALPTRLESNTSYKLAFHLLQQEDRNKEIKHIIANDLLLDQVKFKKTPHRIVGALFLQPSNLEHAQRAKQLYDEMNRNQRFLTSKEDIPYAVFLTANSNVQPKTQADTIMKYYSNLRNNQFTMGNHLQALAQIMTVYSEDYNKIMLEYVVKLREELIERGVKVKKLHYPYLGVLALAATDNSKINELTSLHNQLMGQKIFKNVKDYALIVAIQKIVHDLVEVHNLIDISGLTSILTLFDIVDFVLELGSIIPSGGISDVFDFFN